MSAQTETPTTAEENRTRRTFLLGGDDEETDEEPEVVLLDEYTNRYGDDRVVVETPAPWDTDDGMTPANEVVKSLEWEDHHYTFEETVEVDYDHAYEDVWVIDASGVSGLAQRSLDAGYALVDATDAELGPDLDESYLAALRFAARGDHAVLRYESKQTGDTKSKEGVVTTAQADPDDGTTGLVIRRDDGGTNKLLAGDGGAGEVHSTSRYPFMGEAVSVEVDPGADSEEVYDGWA